MDQDLIEDRVFEGMNTLVRFLHRAPRTPWMDDVTAGEMAEAWLRSRFLPGQAPPLVYYAAQAGALYARALLRTDGRCVRVRGGYDT